MKKRGKKGGKQFLARVVLVNIEILHNQSFIETHVNGD